jgi:hypothetical protein
MPSRSSTRFVRGVAGLAAVGTVVAARAARRRTSAHMQPVDAAVGAPDTPTVSLVEPPDIGEILVSRVPDEPLEVTSARRRRREEDAAIAAAIAAGTTDVAGIVAHVIAVTDRQRSSPVLRRRVEDALGVQAG